MLLYTMSALNWKKARAVNMTGSWTSLVPITSPGNSLSLDADTTATARRFFGRGGGAVPNGLVVQPIGLHATPDNKTGGMRVIGWRYSSENPYTRLLIPTTLIDVDYIVSGTLIGATGLDLLSTEGLADTITSVVSGAGVSSEIISPANDTPAHFAVSLKGLPYYSLDFNVTATSAGGTAVTSCNAFVAEI